MDDVVAVDGSVVVVAGAAGGAIVAALMPDWVGGCGCGACSAGCGMPDAEGG